MNRILITNGILTSHSLMNMIDVILSFKMGAPLIRNSAKLTLAAQISSQPFGCPVSHEQHQRNIDF